MIDYSMLDTNKIKNTYSLISRKKCGVLDIKGNVIIDFEYNNYMEHKNVILELN